MMFLIRVLLAAIAIGMLNPSAWAREPNCPHRAVEVATTPSEKRASNNFTRQILKIRRAPEIPDLVLFGDSLIERWQPFLSDQFDNIRTANLGVSGDLTQHTLRRLDTLHLKINDPSLIALLVGTNNLHKNAEPCAIASGILAVAEKIRQIWPTSRLIVFSIPPRGKKYASYEGQRLETNRLVHTGLLGQGNTDFIQIDDDEFRCGPPSDRYCENFDEDRLHIAKSGYAILADHLKEVIIKTEIR